VAAGKAASLRLPWFRVHIVLLNDPGRLISVHLMHTGLVSGWAATMLTYELLIYDSTDPVFSPMWRQGCYVLPACSRIGVVKSIYGWSEGIDVSTEVYWSYEACLLAHLVLAGLLIIASFWHWAYWDLEVFIASASRILVIDLFRIFAIHLFLASLLCLCFGLFHISGVFGPGIWTSDSFGLVGSIRFVKPAYYFVGLLGKSYGIIGGHHVFAGFLGLFVALWHLSSRPGPLLYKLAGMNNIESVLASSIASVFFTTFITSALMWYGNASNTKLML
jgi:photosystem II CP47 chlorophyll apoprotein